MKIKNLSFALLVLMASCQDKEDEMVMKGNNEPSGSCYRVSALYSTKHTIPVEEAEKNALQMMENLYGSGNGLKSGHKRAVENVQVITKAKSSLKSCNSQLPDTLAYVVSFADSAGFSIVSADDRVVAPVLACVEKGSFSDGAEIPGLQLMIQKAQNYVAASIEDFEEHKDACLSYLQTLDEIPTESKSLKATTDAKKGPYLTTRWAQGSPYNVYCPQCTNCGKNKSVVGCFPVAMGQLMAYHKRGLNLNENTWKLVCLNTAPGAFELQRRYALYQTLYKIGLQNEAEYRCDDCGGTLAGLTWTSKNGGPWRCEWLESNGYNATRYSYSWNRLKKLLDKGPVLMEGKSKQGGHAWVADGYQVLNFALPLFFASNGKVRTVSQYYVHNNWGWGGECNGYFVQDCFDTSKGYSFDNPSFNNSQPYNFNIDLACTEIVPKK